MSAKVPYLRRRLEERDQRWGRVRAYATKHPHATQAAIAKATGVSQPTVCRAPRGHT